MFIGFNNCSNSQYLKDTDDFLLLDKEILFQFKNDVEGDSVKVFSKKLMEDAQDALNKALYSVINDSTVCALDKNNYQSKRRHQFISINFLKKIDKGKDIKHFTILFYN